MLNAVTAHTWSPGGAGHTTAEIHHFGCGFRSVLVHPESILLVDRRHPRSTVIRGVKISRSENVTNHRGRTGRTVVVRVAIHAGGHGGHGGKFITLGTRQIPHKASAHRISPGIDAPGISVVRINQIINHRAGIREILLIVAVGFTPQVVPPAVAAFEHIGNRFGIHRDKAFGVGQRSEVSFEKPPVCVPTTPVEPHHDREVFRGIKVRRQVQQVSPSFAVHRQILKRLLLPGHWSTQKEQGEGNKELGVSHGPSIDPKCRKPTNCYGKRAAKSSSGPFITPDIGCTVDLWSFVAWVLSFVGSVRLGLGNTKSRSNTACRRCTQRPA